MVIGFIAAVAAAAVLLYVAGGRHTVRTEPIGRTVPLSPLDEAERILASRYARGTIDAEEYDRMLAVLRR